MSPSNTKVSIDLQTVFSLANVLKVIGIAMVSFVVVWLNSSYVSIEKFNSLQDRVFVVEQKVLATDKQLENVITMLKNIDLRISNLITPNGNIIYNEKILKMDNDIEVIKKDITYIKEALRR